MINNSYGWMDDEVFQKYSMERVEVEVYQRQMGFGPMDTHASMYFILR